MPRWILAIIATIIGVVIEIEVGGVVGLLLGVAFFVLALYFLIEYAPKGRTPGRR